MKTIILGLLITGLSFLTACESESGKRKDLNKNVIQIIETGEKAIITNTVRYLKNDTVIVKFVHTDDVNRWVLDENWIKFNGTSIQTIGYPRYYKAIVLE